MARSLHAVFILAAVGTVLAGCGGGGKKSTDTTSTVAHAATAAQIAFAEAVNLKEGDARGLVNAKVEPANTSGAGPFGNAVASCEGLKASSGDAVGIDSRRLRRDTTEFSNGAPIESVKSTVYAMGSDAIVSREIAAANSPRGRACLLPLFDSTTTTNGAKPGGQTIFTHSHVARLGWPIREGSGYGIRFAAHSALAGANAHGVANYYEDFFGFAVGHDVVTLTATGSPKPFPLASERRLLRLLYRRATGYKA